ncbi:MAG: putative manganese-dependent inorganic diphosphatase [Oscillospiraceae bacterium]|nr:putative manganese-dependent inorganic diphosphatase [Oscillospiraceae bacterium]
MNEIYVTGHRNPDTDSIVAAMSYAALQNALGHREYVAAHLDHINDETRRMLDRFGFEPPVAISNVRTQVRDLDFDTPPALDASVTMDRAWRIMLEQSISVVPVTTEDGKLHGMLSAGDIASYDMRSITDNHVENLPLFNLLSVLEGRVQGEGDPVDTVSGTVSIAVPQSIENLLFEGQDHVVICGDQPDMIRRALAHQVSCLILCQTDVRPEWLEHVGRTCVISTPFDAAKVVRLVYQAIPVTRACQTKGLVSFHLDDYIDDVREEVLKSRYRCYPVLDENDRVVGTLSRYHLLRPRRKRVVLVDHNERAQAVPGLDQAEILEIIDHHRLADIQTAQPVRMRNEPVGSTNTIIAGMYQEYGVMPSPNMAGLIASAILSDTVIFKSPTCTKRDIDMAERMARIAKVSLEEVGKELFSASGSDDKSAEELFLADFKEFHIAEQKLGVSQITCVDSARLLERKAEFLELMASLRKTNRYDMVILMLTDVLLEGTQLVYLGSDDTISRAFSIEPHDNTLFLPRVMSRKKQIIPMLTALWG